MSRERSEIVFFVVVYILLFNWSYLSVIQPLYGYLGAPLKSLSHWDFLIVFILSLLPSFFIPFLVFRPSRALCWLLYTLVYVPSLIYLGYSHLPLKIIFLILVGFLIINLSGVLPVFRIIKVRISRKHFWLIFWAVLLGFMFVVFVAEGSSMKLVNVFDFESVYEQRSKGSGSRISGYLTNWLAGAFFPILLAWGLAVRNKYFILSGILGQVFIFMVAAGKASIFSIGLLFGVYWIVRNGNFKKFGIKLLTSLNILLFVLTNIQISNYSEIKSFLYPVTTQFLFRLLCNTGFNFSMYYDFFLTHPFTYYSHINIVGKFIEYPFDVPLGYAVTGSKTWNSNASFWITDGFAAIGPIGIILISIVCCFIFMLMDSVTYGLNRKFSIVLMSYFAIPIFNISLFTSILTGGIAVVFFIILFFKK